MASRRSNQYFVPRDGIDREVITADICRYLGNDALVRPGEYENPETHQIQQGYYINAYRNLTTAMIDDLKADSARWEAERRAAQARHPTSGGSYRNSEVHIERQAHGPTETSSPAYSNPYGRDAGYDFNPRYQGTGNSAFQGAPAGYQAPVQQHTFPSEQSPYGGRYPTSQDSFSPDSRYGGHPQSSSMMNQGGYATSSNAPRGFASPSEAYPGNRMPVVTGASMPPQYTSAPPQQQPTYSGSYHPSQPTSGSAEPSYAAMHPQNGFGRASPGQAPQPSSGHTDDRYNRPPRR